MVEFIENANLEKFCTIKIGGKARKVYLPKNVEDIAYLIKLSQDKDKRLIPIGIGSNVVFRDGILEDIFVSTSKLKDLKIYNENGHFYIEAEAGVSFKTIVNLVKKYNLEGFENLSGIPATVGGATTMNAGASGTEIFDIIEEVHWIDNEGNLNISPKDEIEYSYRKTQFQGNGFVYKTKIKLKKSNKNITQIIKEHLLERNRKQPLDLPTCGSTFKNPPNNYAGRLIESVGLKGYKINDIGFSPKHANFSVNYGNGKFKDFQKLIDTAKEKVFKEFGIQLQEEVQIIP
jgi:UDP-N-acetylmuramate dehydrogenase